MKALTLFAVLALLHVPAHADESGLEGELVNSAPLEEVPNKEQAADYGWQFDPRADTGTVEYHAENRHELVGLQLSKDCGKSAALEAAKTSMKRIKVFRALVERDKKNLADVQKALAQHEHPADFWGAKSEANAIPLMTKTLDDLQYASTDGRFANLKVACTEATGTSLHQVAFWDKQYDKAILTGNPDDRVYDPTPEALLSAAGKVVPSKSFDVPPGHLGFIHSIQVANLRSDMGGCYFRVPFDGQAVAKITQEKTYDGKKLEFACDPKFKGVQLVTKGDVVQVQIHEQRHTILGGVDYPDSLKIMDKVLEATDGPGATYKWEDYGSTDGLKAEFFR